MNNLEKWLISIEQEKAIEEIRKRACRRPERDSPLWWLGLPAEEVEK